MKEAKRVLKMSIWEGLGLQSKALLGDVQATKEFVLYSIWKKIQSDKYIPAKKKKSVFLELVKNLDIEVKE